MSTPTTRYVEATHASIFLTTPAGREVEFVYFPRSTVSHLDPYHGMFVSHHSFEYAYNLASIAHIHLVNRELDFTTGVFDVKIHTGYGEEHEVHRIYHLTLEQLCELLDRDDLDFALHIASKRGLNYNKHYWPTEWPLVQATK